MAEPAAQPQSGSNTWEAEKARMESENAQLKQQLSGLSNERNAFRQRAEAWERLGKEAGDIVDYDARTGLPMRWKTDDASTRQPVPYAGGHPLTGVVENPNAVDGYYQQLYQAQLNAAGYVTAAQAQAMAAQALQVASGNFQVVRNYDRLTSQESYKSLADTSSKLYERTGRVLQERNWGRPVAIDPFTGQAVTGTVPFDRWQYRDLQDLQSAADLASMQLEKEAKAADAAQAQAQAAQGAAGLSVGGGGAATVYPSGEVPVGKNGEPDWDKLRADTQTRATQLGVS